MPSLTWNASLANDLAPMDATHREFIECYNAAAAAAPEAFLPAFDRLIEHTQAHFDLENGWMAAVDFPGCHRAEHDRVLAVMLDALNGGGDGLCGPQDLFVGQCHGLLRYAWRLWSSFSCCGSVPIPVRC